MSIEGEQVVLADLEVQEITGRQAIIGVQVAISVDTKNHVWKMETTSIIMRTTTLMFVTSSGKHNLLNLQYDNGYSPRGGEHRGGGRGTPRGHHGGGGRGTPRGILRFYSTKIINILFRRCWGSWWTKRTWWHQ